jgi:RNA polymerase sigma-70 factor (ECF subfamily)
MEFTDQEAVKQTLKDPHAFSVLVDRYQDPLSRYVRRLGAVDPEAAKDILQESFIKAYINLNDYNPSLPFSSWLYRITHNETMMHFRRMKSRPQPLPNEEDLLLFERIPDELDIEKETDLKLRADRVGKALRKLSPLYRDVIVLRFFEGKSYDEISDILQIPGGTVATYLFRGKRDLKKGLTSEHITDVYYGHDV